MDTGILSTIAEIALALAGFSGIVVAFTREPGQLTDLESYRLTLLFGPSLGAVFLALLPWALSHSGLEGEEIWRLASGIMAAYTVVLVCRLIGPTRRFLREARDIFDLRLLIPIALGHVVNGGVQAANALGGFGIRSQAVFVWGLLWLVFHAAHQFSRILFKRPR